MAVQSLGYIGIGVKDVSAWKGYAADILGCEVNAGPGGGLRLRVDSRDWRIAIEPTGEDDLVFSGWEVAGPGQLEALLAKIEAAGTPVTRDDGSLAARRGVLGVATCTDPSGNICELFWGATDRSERPFVSPQAARFVTGDLGLGHIVIGAKDPAAMQHFYGDVLGFRFSDHIDMRVGPDLSIPVAFWHCNARHHSLAFAPTPPEAPALIHFMLQVDNFNDVGFALDRCEKHGVKFATTLGLHANDHMLSFYAYTPSGFEVEYGFGAREIDDVTWVPVRHDVTSSWGHKFIGHGAQRG